MIENDSTIEFYNQNAKQYFKNTVNADMSGSYNRFENYVVPGGRIVDLGSGSGRDAKHFKDKGFYVEAIDASEELCLLASQYAGVQVRCETIQEWAPSEPFDGIWANASLLHLKLNEIETFICKSPQFLNDGGVLYFSMKHGICDGVDSEGRFFSDYSEEIVRSVVLKCKEYEMADLWYTDDSMGRDEVQWLNVILKKIS